MGFSWLSYLTIENGLGFPVNVVIPGSILADIKLSTQRKKETSQNTGLH